MSISISSLSIHITVIYSYMHNLSQKKGMRTHPLKVSEYYRRVRCNIFKENKRILIIIKTVIWTLYFFLFLSIYDLANKHPHNILESSIWSRGVQRNSKVGGGANIVKSLKKFLKREGAGPSPLSVRLWFEVTWSLLAIHRYDECNLTCCFA